MRKVICQLHELSFQLQDGRSRAFAHGQEYDLDERLGTHKVTDAQGVVTEQPLLLEDVIGEYISGFEPVIPASAALPQGDEQ